MVKIMGAVPSDTAAAAGAENSRAYYNVAQALEQAYVPSDHGGCRQGKLSMLSRHQLQITGSSCLATPFWLMRSTRKVGLF